ncbi:DUF1902 domain-containing protein [Pseudohalocynthiibacter aestuariivivens]|nr:DUF1902 domain-containing protein [Pseudohalocynthiibacter aestuariivivens]QIE44796.1 DUF1902 domain-containing protein [Pseudohalocynthiibacter aestuariivivens]
MSKMRFYIKAVWDEDAEIFYSESDIIGLHIEAATVEDFQVLMEQLAPEMVLENHVSKRDLSKKSILDMIPSIFFTPPTIGAATA